MRLRTLFLFSAAPFVFVGAIITAVLAVAAPGASDGGAPSATGARIAMDGEGVELGALAAASTVDSDDVVVATTPSADGPTRQHLSGSDQIHQDYNMTQYMSGPNADGPMFTGQMTDPQLLHSNSPAFIRELEQHQRDMDRMLARGEP